MPSRAKTGRITSNAMPRRDLEKSRAPESNAGQYHTRPGTAGAEAYDAVFVSLAVFQRPMIAYSWEALYPTRLSFRQPETKPCRIKCFPRICDHRPLKYYKRHEHGVVRFCSRCAWSRVVLSRV